jgi:phosphoesterase RecJ-like protein
LKINNISELQAILEGSTNIVVTTHTNPDGDAIGSSLALFHFLRDRGKNVNVVVPNKYPTFISWMPGDDQILVYEQEHKKSQSVIAEADLIFCLDYNAIHRSGSLQDILKVAEAPRIMIDHHPAPETEAFRFVYSSTETSSTSEMIYDFITQVADDQAITKDIATCLFVGIMTDTGSFSFACNRPQTFEVTAALIKTGIDIEWIHRKVYDTFSEDRLRLLGFSLSEKLVVKPEYATAYIALSKQDLERFNYQVGDTEGIVNYALSIEGITMAILLTERRGRIRLSFRSKGDFSVNDIARDHFQGGGHRNAAGGDVYDSLKQAIIKLEELLPVYKDALLSVKGA